MSWNKWESAAERGPWSLFTRLLVLFVAITVVVGIAGFVLNPFRQAGRIVDKTIDADNVLYNYEWFKQQFRSVGAIDKKIVAQEKAVSSIKSQLGLRSEWTRDDRIEHDRLASIVTGLEQQRADMVATYNARAAMANRQIFMGSDCPEHLQ